METQTSIAPPPPPSVIFTDAAAHKVSELISEEDNPNLKLRVFISGGGCSGFQYGFTFDESVEDGDSQVENQGVMLAGRSHERAISDGCRDRLQGRPAGSAVHHPEPERANHLWLRVVFYRLDTLSSGMAMRVLIRCLFLTLSSRLANRVCKTCSPFARTMKVRRRYLQGTGKFLAQCPR